MSREMFHAELDRLGDDLASMCTRVAGAMGSATRALTAGDVRLAEQVITGDAEIDVDRARCEERAVELLALQAPVARDLRTVVSLIRVAEHLERMGDLARHVSELVRRRYPAAVAPPELVERLTEMGRLGEHAARELCTVMTAPGTARSAEFERADDRIDELHRHVLTAVTSEGSPYDVRTAVDVALLARFFERFADQAVSVMRRLDFVTTGRVRGGAGGPASGSFR